MPQKSIYLWLFSRFRAFLTNNARSMASSIHDAKECERCDVKAGNTKNDLTDRTFETIMFRRFAVERARFGLERHFDTDKLAKSRVTNCGVRFSPDEDLLQVG